jgi:ribonuclease HI
MKLQLSTDGGSRGNPGPSATGVILKNENGAIIAAYGEYLGIQTNNVAEYRALLSGLTTAKELGATEVDCVLDSELIVKQMNGQYKVRNPELQKIFLQIYNLRHSFKKITFRHTLRAGNKEADAEVNKILDAEQQKNRT